jgi:ElaB/YqjD/DUF883 family membrane-anchored ribosome-binding protein
MQQSGSVMAEQQPNTDVAALQIEIQQLRADLAKIAGTIHEIASNRVTSAGQQMQASTDRVWTEVKRQADSVSREIEQNPIAAALTAFSAGVLLGLLLNRHRS